MKGEKFKLLELYYKGLVRNGANLKSNEKKRVAEINQKLSLLSLAVWQNILDTINDYKLIITDKADLAGLTEDLIVIASDNASKAGHPGKWIFTLQNASGLCHFYSIQSIDHSVKPFGKHINKGNNGDDFDNNNISFEIIKLRAEKANILGYSSHAHYVLEEHMAKSPDQVYDLLNYGRLPSK